MPDSPIVYQVDENDLIVLVNTAWDAFARANDGDDALSARVVGLPIWGFFSDPTTIEIYRRLVKRVRLEQVPVEFTIRCDGPTVRRVLSLRISPVGDRLGLEFRTTVLQSSARIFTGAEAAGSADAVAGGMPTGVDVGAAHAVDVGTPTGDDVGAARAIDEPALLRACGWCSRVNVDGEWLELDDALPRLGLLMRTTFPQMTHGICEECLQRMLRGLEPTPVAAVDAP